jgi:hypothetical protein
MFIIFIIISFGYFCKTMFHHVRLIILLNEQAVAGYCGFSPRLPPLPDPDAASLLIWRCQSFYLPWLLFMSLLTMHRYSIQVQWLAIMVMALSAYYFGFALLDLVLYWVDVIGNDDPYRVWRWFRIKAPSPTSVISFTVSSVLQLGSTTVKTGIGVSPSMVSLLLWCSQWASILWISFLATSVGTTLSDSRWFYDPDSTGETSMAYAILLLVECFLPGIALCAWKTILFVIVDVPSVIWETISPNSLTNLHNEIHQIFSKAEWSVEEDDPTNPSAFVIGQQAPPAARRISPWHAKLQILGSRFWKLILLMCMLTQPVVDAISDVDCLATSDPPELCSQGSFSYRADRLGWRDRRKFKRWSERTESSIPNPFNGIVHPIIPPAPQVSPISHDVQPSTRLDRFVKSFDPASAGMQLLLVERMDRLLTHQVKKKRKRVSVHLQNCLMKMASSEVKWTFPIYDAAVFNTLVDGIDSPLIVDSGASCCVSPHREDFITYHESKAKSKTSRVPTQLPVKE